MDVKLDGVCRGDGLIYAKLAIAADEAITFTAIEASNGNGQKLPCRWYDVSKPRMSPAECAVVAVLPLLEKGVQNVLVICELEGGGIASSALVLAMERVKWESRINYRLRKGLTDELRDIEKRDAFKQINFWIDHVLAISDTGESIVHGGLWYLENPNVRPELEFLDECGNKLDIEPIVVGEEVRPYRLDPYITIRNVLLSYRIPTEQPSFTIVANDSNNPGLWGFLTFDPGMLGQARDVGWNMYTNAGADNRYHEWFMRNRVEPCVVDQQRTITFDHDAEFSIVVPLFKTPVELFRDMADSVVGQSYQKWELVLVNASPEDEDLAREIERYQAMDARVRVVQLESNLGIVGNTNAGIGQAQGDFICFLDHDDVLEPDALFEYARALERDPETGMLYCDEDKLLPNGLFANPFFKTDFNIDLLRCHNYVCHFLCVRKQLLEEVGLSEERHNGAQDHDIALKCAESASSIAHVKRVLYHWRVVEGSTASADQSVNNPKSYANEAGAIAIREHLDRLGIEADVEETKWMYTHHVKYHVTGEPLVSIIIPNKDCVEMLDDCLRSILDKTTYANYEIVVVENNSVDQATFEYYRRAEERYDAVRVVRWPGEFNFSKIVNFGASEARGDYLLFLNNDTAVIEPAWLEYMLGVCQRDDVGVVGAKLLYSDGTMQHAGVVLSSIQEVAYHAYARMPETYDGYFLQAGLTMDYSAVTGACMLTKRSAFQSVGGFDEELTVAFNDIDYCLKVRQQGLLVVYEPAARLYHFESISRGFDSATVEKQTRFAHESGIMHQKWARVYIEGDPFFSPHMQSGYHQLKFG